MAKKKTETKEKVDKLNASVSYDGEGELLSDISSSEPLTKKTPKKATKTKKDKKIEEKINVFIEKTIVELSDGELFNNVLQSGEYFYLRYKGTIIYDSIKNKDSKLIFQNNNFYLDGDKYSYTGLSLKFKK